MRQATQRNADGMFISLQDQGDGLILIAEGLEGDEQADACDVARLRPAERSALARALSSWVNA